MAPHAQARGASGTCLEQVRGFFVISINKHTLNLYQHLLALPALTTDVHFFSLNLYQPYHANLSMWSSHFRRPLTLPPFSSPVAPCCFWRLGSFAFGLFVFVVLKGLQTILFIFGIFALVFDCLDYVRMSKLLFVSYC